MLETNYIEILTNRKKVVISVPTILYVLMTRKCAEIHVSGGTIYETRMTIGELEKKLGEGFIKVHRGCLVSVMAIHDITDHVNLSNGEKLVYTLRKKKEIISLFREKQKDIIDRIVVEGIPMTKEEYRRHYSSFDNMPFAFADIEMVFDEESRAIDWIFRYGNPALAELEKVPLERLIGSSFGSLFSNMDAKWLRSYERATLYGEMLEMMDYSPEIDAYLKVICFPTFKGHCGCILMNISKMRFTKNSDDTETTLKLYFEELLKENEERLLE